MARYPNLSTISTLKTTKYRISSNCVPRGSNKSAPNKSVYMLKPFHNSQILLSLRTNIFPLNTIDVNCWVTGTGMLPYGVHRTKFTFYTFLVFNWIKHNSLHSFDRMHEPLQHPNPSWNSRTWWHLSALRDSLHQVHTNWTTRDILFRYFEYLKRCYCILQHHSAYNNPLTYFLFLKPLLSTTYLD